MPTPPPQNTSQNIAAPEVITAPQALSAENAPPASPPENKNSHILALGIAAGVFLFIVIVAAVFTYFLPRKNTQKMVSDVLPKVSELKTSIKSVRTEVDKMRFIITDDIKTNSPPLNTSGLLIHPEVAGLLLDTNVLGTSTARESGFVGTSVMTMTQNLNESLNSLKKSKGNVAGVKTVAENQIVSKLRSLKDETIKAAEYITKAEGDLSSIQSNTKKLPLIISQSSKESLGKSKTIDDIAVPYLKEARKMTNYYDVLSDILIAMNTKISSFKASINNASNAFGSIQQANGNTEIIKTSVSQSRVFLQQANQDATEIKKLSAKLLKFSKEDLPMSANEYHNHNTRVLEVVGEYFDAETSVMQSYLDAADKVIPKIENKSVTPQDVNVFSQSVLNGVSKAQVAEAKFLSDMQSLLGEETTLTLSFWQNSTWISNGGKIEAEIDRYHKELDTLKAANSIAFLK